MRNAYEVRGDVTAIFIDSPKYGRLEALISTSKLERAKDFPNKWCAHFNKGNKSFYIFGKNHKREKNIYLHRYITGSPDGMVVDHIDHNTLNNIDKNLRIITTGENMQNRSGIDAKNKSGVRGVFWFKRDRKWRAQVTVNKRPIHIGLFDTIEEAEKSVIEARKKYLPYSQEALAK
jgi:hypothetical protein